MEHKGKKVKKRMDMHQEMCLLVLCFQKVQLKDMLMTCSRLRIIVLPISLMHAKIMAYLVEVDMLTQGMIKNIWGRIFLWGN
jgi:hypothetical protein